MFAKLSANIQHKEPLNDPYTNIQPSDLMSTMAVRSKSKDHHAEDLAVKPSSLTKNKTFMDIITTVPDNPNGMQKFIKHRIL